MKLTKDLVHLVRGSRHLFFRAETLDWALTDEMGAKIIGTLGKGNSVEGAAAEIAVKEGLPSSEVLPEVERFLRVLEEAKLLVSKDERTPAGDAQEEIRPSDLYLHLTARCNLKCIYCYNKPLREEGRLGGDLPLPLALQALQQAKELGIHTVLFTGGEPLLHPQALRIAEAAHELGFRTIMLTNGLLIDERIARALAQTCDQVTVSLDSAVPELHDLHRGSGTHVRVVRAIRRLKEAGVREVAVSGVLTRLNQREHHTEFEAFAKGIGANRAVRQIYIPQGDDRDALLTPDFSTLLPEMEKAVEEAVVRKADFEGSDLTWRDRCGAASGVLAIGADGAVYPCQSLMLPEFRAGSIGDATLAEIYESSEVLKKVRDVTVADIPRCRDCVFRHVCGGGCRALAYNIYRSLTTPIPEQYCAFNRILAEGRLWAAALSGQKEETKGSG